MLCQNWHFIWQVTCDTLQVTCWVSEHHFKTSDPLLFWFRREGVYLWAVQIPTSILPFTLLSKPTKLNGFSESLSQGFTRFWSVRTWSIWFKMPKKKLCGKKRQKLKKWKNGRSLFLPGFSWSCNSLSRFVWIRLSFVCHGLGTSVSNLVNLCIWKRLILK